jgi:hypothetical protein
VPSGAGTDGVRVLIRAFLASTLMAATAGAAAAAATTTPADTLVSSSPWWEKLVVTVSAGTDPQCVYQSSLAPGESQKCDVDGDGLSGAVGANEGDKSQATAITFERRFSPGPVADAGMVGAGDTLLGKSVIALAIGKDGRVQGCKIVSSGGDMTPEYGCAEARAERFKTAAPAINSEPLRTATMTILVYAHAEHYA